MNRRYYGSEAAEQSREIANHLLRTYRSFLEGFIMLQIHNSFGNPISLEESFEISLNVMISGMDGYRNKRGNKKRLSSEMLRWLMLSD